MSSEAGPSHGYNPAKLPGKPTKVTLDEMKDVAAFFKNLFEESKLAWWIKLAGIGALAELLHVAWLAIRYIWKF